MESEILPLLDGLLYPSESDEPVVYMCMPHAGDGWLSTEDLSKLILIDPDTSVAERDPSRFWSAVTTQQEWYDAAERVRTDRFSRLKDILDGNLENIQYFEVGETEVILYYIGVYGQSLRGVRTMAVRT